MVRLAYAVSIAVRVGDGAIDDYSNFALLCLVNGLCFHCCLAMDVASVTMAFDRDSGSAKSPSGKKGFVPRRVLQGSQGEYHVIRRWH